MIEKLVAAVSTVGPLIEFVGAILMVLPDIPVIKAFIFPNALAEARQELFNTSSLTQGSEEFDAILSLVQTEWEGELREQPWAFLIEKPHSGFEQSLFAIYDEESEGPYGDLRTDDGYESFPDKYDDVREYIWESEKWDILCGKQVIDDWIAKKVDKNRYNALILRGSGFCFFIIGFVVQYL